MGVIIPNGAVLSAQEVTVVGANAPFVVTLGHVDNTGQGPNFVADAVRDAWAATLLPPGNLRTGYSLGPCRIYRRSGGGVLEYGENLTVSPGQDPNSNAPTPNAAVLIRKVTGLVGPRNRGRIYLPPATLNEGSVDQAGIMAGANQAVLQAQADSFLTGLGTNGVPMYLLHSDGGPATEVVSLTVQARLATQRRRLR